ncbi:MAG: ribulose-phosphate 3-epimerase [Anaerolinea sp.]|nr:ribulose-phosphate 3-epimerase [Anaerolinea sp.]
MTMPFLLSASILSADFATLGDQLAQAQAAGCDWLHIDVMDGHFVPNITMGPFIVATCRRASNLPLDVHLMIEKPEQHIEAFAKAGANTLSVHIEGNPNIHRTLQSIRALGCKAGIVLNPGTPASAIEAVLPWVDMVLVMTVNPGYSGQPHIAEMSTKIAHIRQMLNQRSSPALLEVDGGITAQTLPACYQAGANVFVAATAIFQHPQGIAAGVRALRSVVP